MNSLQPTSLKITKKPKTDKSKSKFICGGCSKYYKSYPALYLHIKNKHQGVRPPNTRIAKVEKPPVFVPTAQTGRPSKPIHNIDDLSMNELYLEETQNELLGFLGEKLMVISGFEDKLKLEDAIRYLMLIPPESQDKWFTAIQTECQALYREYGENINLDFEEEVRTLDPDNSLRALVWFLLWLSKHFVKKEFMPNLCVVMSKIWKVLEETNLQIQDLDNKLVWKKTMAECKPLMANLTYFRGSEELIYEFIQKICQLIGKSFEQGN